jgi:hypothetical protein
MNIIEEKTFLINLFEFINKVPCKSINHHKYWKEKINYLTKTRTIDDDLINNYHEILNKNGYNTFRRKKKYLCAYTQWGFNDKLKFILSNHYNF